MAGPFTARILADEFDAVTVIDRDSLTGELTAHRDVPQGHASAVGRVACDEQVVSPRFVQFERRHQSASLVHSSSPRDFPSDRFDSKVCRLASL
ncbi:hypothetical protein ACFFQF_04225 [Haladaptatus pallidirubidus]